MLPSRASSTTCTNVFGDTQTTHKSLRPSCINSKGEIPKFHTPEFVRGLEANLDEHKRVTSMFQQATKYSA